MERIGFVGVGLMGEGMAASLMRAGHPLTVIAHRNREPVERLVALGASEAADLESLAAASDIVHVCAPGTPEVEAIVAALEPGLAEGAMVIDCSTAIPESSAAMADRLAARGVAFVDAPLGGTPVQAAQGKLSAMVGATDEAFVRARPVIQAWAASVVHIGGPGDGHRAKLIMNFLSLGYGALYAEALTVAAKAGLDADQVDSFIRGSRMDCGFYQTFMACVTGGDREAHRFTLTNAAKDTRYLEAMAQGAGVANPLGNAVKNAYQLALSQGGDGPADYVPHLPDFMARMNGTAIRARVRDKEGPSGSGSATGQPKR